MVNGSVYSLMCYEGQRAVLLHSHTKNLKRNHLVTKGASQEKNTGLFGSFSHTGGGRVLLDPKTLVI